MKTDDKPVQIMAKTMPFRSVGGKFLLTLVEDQSSAQAERMIRMGMERKLL